VCLGINDGHFADVLAGTSPSYDSSIDDNRERSAQYSKEISVRGILRHKDCTGGYRLERNAFCQLNRQVFVMNEGLRTERFNKAHVSFKALESSKR
jgi:RNA:NAD 2'-phosphotransferase (TPT1/KptA family)